MRLATPTAALAAIPFVMPASRNVNDEKYRTPLIPANCCKANNALPIAATTFNTKQNQDEPPRVFKSNFFFKRKQKTVIGSIGRKKEKCLR